jgi:hypothetical protein
LRYKVAFRGDRERLAVDNVAEHSKGAKFQFSQIGQVRFGRVSAVRNQLSTAKIDAASLLNKDFLL